MIQVWFIATQSLFTVGAGIIFKISPNAINASIRIELFD
jgi:hypothetical protein